MLKLSNSRCSGAENINTVRVDKVSQRKREGRKKSKRE